MRVHKCRVWDKEQQRMSPVAEISFGDDGSAKTIVVQPAPKGEYSRQLVHGENAVLMDYSGLKDCDEVEVCEGDLLLLEGTVLGLVVYENAAFMVKEHGYRWSLNSFAQDNINVVGNIYEHPELLGDRQQ